MKVLVVDDESDVKLIFEQYFRKELRKNQITLNFAYSGEEAIEFITKDEDTGLTLILSDINMPGMNGLQLLKKVKDRFPEMKVFMITAYDDDHKYQTAHQYGCDEYFTKPLDFAVLKEKIKEVCKLD